MRSVSHFFLHGGKMLHKIKQLAETKILKVLVGFEQVLPYHVNI